VGRVYDGSVQLALHGVARSYTRARDRVRRIAGWVGAADGFDKLMRLGFLALLILVVRKVATAIVVWAYHRITSGTWGLPLFLAAAVWIVAAYRAGHPDWTPKPPKQRPAEASPDQAAADGDSHAQDADPAGAVALEKQPPAPPVEPAELVAAVRAIGTPHAQLKPLAEHLSASTDAVRATAARLGWEVKDVRMAGRSASAGLRGDEAPSLPPPEPLPGVVGAGQPADDNDDDSGQGSPRKGLRVEPIGLGGRLVHDPADVIRHHKTTH
jgi:hypothetical protein